MKIKELKRLIEIYKDAIIDYPYKSSDRKVDVQVLMNATIELTAKEIVNDFEQEIKDWDNTDVTPNVRALVKGFLEELKKKYTK